MATELIKDIENNDYNGEIIHTQFYSYIFALGMWMGSFRIPRKHDTLPVVHSTPQRAYFLNVLSKLGMPVANGQIPTPIASYFLSDYELKHERDTPKEVRLLNENDGYLYSNLIPYDCTFIVSFWTRLQMDMFELMYQLQTSFNQGIHWIEMIDGNTGRTQTTPFFLESIADSSNLEPGDTDNVEWRKDVTIRAECYVPRPGFYSYPVKKVYYNLRTGSEDDNCTIEYISGDAFVKKVNTGMLCGVISSGNIYFSGTVNVGEHDEEFVVENFQW